MEDSKVLLRAPARRRRLRWVGGIAAVLAGLFVLHTAAARWLLSTPTLRRWINTQPEATWIEWDEATSIWPGLVDVRGVRIRGRDQNVQWIFRIEQGRLRYSIAELAARRFHVLRLDVEGLSFRLRKNRRPDDPEPTPVSLQPPILGFADPPRAAPAGEPGRIGNPWTIRIEDIAIRRLSEIWVDMYRFQGDASLTGRFRLRPGLAAEVGPATIDFASGDVRLGREPVLRLDPSRISARFEPWDPRVLQGDAVWRRVTGEIRMSGFVPGLAFANYFLRRARSPRLDGGSGRTRIRARIEDGVARGDVALGAGSLGVQTAVSSLSTSVRAVLEVRRWDLERGPLDLSGSRIELTGLSSEPDGSRGWWGRIAIPRGTLGDLLDARISIAAMDARPILSALGATVPKLARAVLKLEGLDASGRIRAGRGHLELRELDAKGGRLHMEGDFRQIGHRQDGVFFLDAGKFNFGVAVRDGRSHLRVIATRDWFERERRAIAGRAPSPEPQTARSTTTAVP
jgi:hypothetical protein